MRWQAALSYRKDLHARIRCPTRTAGGVFQRSARSLQDLANQTINPTLISSPWLRGYFRELLVREFLQPLIPHTCRLVTGTVVDVNSWRNPPREHPQDDILLVDGECLPPLFEVTDNGMYPVESVLARFEVKTTIADQRDIDSVLSAAEEFWKLEPNMAPSRRMEVAARPDFEPDPRPLQVLFAFNINPWALDRLQAGLDEHVREAFAYVSQFLKRIDRAEPSRVRHRRVNRRPASARPREHDLFRRSLGRTLEYLEEREWRIVFEEKLAEGWHRGRKEPPYYLPIRPGFELFTVVLPDNRTVNLALSDRHLRAALFPQNAPHVTILSLEDIGTF